MSPTVVCAAGPAAGDEVVRVAADLAAALDVRLVLARPAAGRPQVGAALDAAAAQRAELVVVGSRWRTRVLEALRPGAAAQLIACAPCPVVVVAPAASDGLATQRTAARLAGGEGAAGGGGAAPVLEGAVPSIVCGVDDSRAGATALRVAARLAEALDLRLVAAHVLDPGAGTAPAPQGVLAVEFEDLLERERRGAVRLLRRSLAQAPEVDRRQIRIAQGPPARELERLAAAEAAQLVAVGTRAFGRGPRLAALRGSTALRLATRARVPVVVAGPAS